MFFTENWTDYAPGLAQLRNYRKQWLHRDVMAGLTVAAYLVPQVMAYATLAGLPPISGLWVSLVALCAYAVFGSSRKISVGPESTTSLMTAVVLAPLAGGSSTRYAVLAAALAIMVGLVLFVAALARLGFMASLLSRPVLVGYMTGIAIVMAASQLGRITGVAVEGDEFVDLLKSFARGASHVNWPTIVLAASVLGLLLALDRWAPNLPGPLIAVFVATLALYGLSLHGKGIEVVGTISPGWPTPALPRIAPGEMSVLILPAIGIALVSFVDNMLTASAFARPGSTEVDANAELRALGVANVATGVTQGFPVSASNSRTALGDAVGSKTQMYSLVAMTVVLAITLWGRGILADFPVPALGALVVFAALRLVNIAEYRRLARFRRSELLLAILTAATVVGLGVLYGVLAAVALSILDLLRRIAHAHDSVLGFVPGVAGMHDIDDYPEAEPVPGLVIYRYDAPLCFANAQDFRRRALAAVDHYGGPVEWFVLNAEANVEVDLTALDMLDQLREELARRGIVFAMARVKQDLRASLLSAGLLERIGQDRIYMTLPTAVEAFKNR